MAKDVVLLEGVVTEALPDSMFRIEIDHMKQEVLAKLSGKMRKFKIRILPGDQVQVEVSPYDLTRGRVTRRL